MILLAVFALAEVTEGGVDTWGVLYLRNHLATGVLLGAGAYVVGQLMAVTTRGAGGPLLGRMSSRHALIVGGCVAGSGILLESLTSLSWMAAVGLALGAGGASLFWPLVMSTVSRLATQVVSAVGTFTAAGYIGWVAGAPIVGWVSQIPGSRARVPGPGGRLVRGGGLHPVHTLAKCRDRDQRVAWAGRHDPSQHRDARRHQGPHHRGTRSNCATRSGRSSSMP